jgi:hypothetical protein
MMAQLQKVGGNTGKRLVSLLIAIRLQAQLGECGLVDVALQRLPNRQKSAKT